MARGAVHYDTTMPNPSSFEPGTRHRPLTSAFPSPDNLLPFLEPNRVPRAQRSSTARARGMRGG
eukprot:scaffold63517_cov27-Tisochrysis_lutea.AAC.2